MRISPAGIGKIAGVVLCIAVIGTWVLWSRTDYSVRGTVQVDTGTYISPGDNIDVHLILASVEEDIKKLVEDFSQLKTARMSQAVITLIQQSTPEKPKDDSGLSIEHVISDSLNDTEPAEPAETAPADDALARALREAPDEEEKNEIQQRINTYRNNAEFCRECMPACPIGENFYQQAAQYWEGKAAALEEKGRLVYDEATVNYETTWQTYNGLGEEPVQLVSREVRVDPGKLRKAEEQLTGPEKQPEKKKEETPKEVLQAIEVPTNDIMNAAGEIERVLKERSLYAIAETENLLREKILETRKTDMDGSFVFKGDDVQPGGYIIFTRYDVLSTEGEPVEFMWYQPVTVPVKRFALKKAVTVNLDELNQAKPATLDLYVPERDELYLQLIDGIQKKRTEQD
jgi:hypothetical protein